MVVPKGEKQNKKKHAVKDGRTFLWTIEEQQKEKQSNSKAFNKQH